MTLPNDPFDFLWRHEADAPRPTSGGTPGGAPKRSEPGKHFEPDLDAFFDDDLSDDESELLYEHIRRERELAAEMFGTQRALDALRATPHCPDFSQRILKQVDRKRGLLSGPWLQRVFIGRVAIAAGLLLAMGGLFALHRASPELATIGQPTPIGQLASALPTDASRTQRSGDSGAMNSGAPGWAAGLNIESAAMDSRAALHARSIANAGPEARRVLVEAGETLPMGGDGVVFIQPSDAVIVSSASQMAVEFPGLRGVAVVHDDSHEAAFQAMLSQHAQPVMVREDMNASTMYFSTINHPIAVAMVSPAASPTINASEPPAIHEPPRGAGTPAVRPAITARPAQPILTDDCVYYMGRVMDRHSFQTVLAGFTAMAPIAFD